MEITLQQNVWKIVLKFLICSKILTQECVIIFVLKIGLLIIILPVVCQLQDVQMDKLLKLQLKDVFTNAPFKNPHSKIMILIHVNTLVLKDMLIIQLWHVLLYVLPNLIFMPIITVLSDHCVSYTALLLIIGILRQDNAFKIALSRLISRIQSQCHVYNNAQIILLPKLLVRYVYQIVGLTINSDTGNRRNVW